MKVTRILAITGLALFFVGCAGQGIDLNRQHIVFVDGKPFHIPNGTVHTNRIYTNSKILSVYRQNGLDCREGDVFWATPDVAKKGVSIIQSGNMIGGHAYMANASKEGRAGCAHPLSNREYSFYRQNDAEQAARDYAIRSQIANNIVNSTPKTYNVNVNHSGYINQNVNYSGYINTHNYRY